MAAFAQYSLIGALIFVAIALVMNLVVVASQNRVVGHPRVVAAASDAAAAGSAGATSKTVSAALSAGGSASTSAATATLERDADAELAELDDEPPAPAKKAAKQSVAPKKTAALNVGSLATGFTVVAWALITAYIIARWAQAGHIPLINMNGYAAGLVWVILLSAIVAFWRFRVRLVSVVALVIATAMLIYATTVEFAADPLVPALQNSVLLTLHVGFAIIASGAGCVAFAGAALYLLYPHIHRLKTPRATFDEISYKGAVVTFPLWTIMVLFGALWANTAWGTYWSWDPKETAALVTWLIYAAFLHARVVGGWRGTRSAWLQVLAFIAVLFTLFGNYFFGGLHSYS